MQGTDPQPRRDRPEWPLTLVFTAAMLPGQIWAGVAIAERGAFIGVWPLRLLFLAAFVIVASLHRLSLTKSALVGAYAGAVMAVPECVGELHFFRYPGSVWESLVGAAAIIAASALLAVLVWSSAWFVGRLLKWPRTVSDPLPALQWPALGAVLLLILAVAAESLAWAAVDDPSGLHTVLRHSWCMRSDYRTFILIDRPLFLILAATATYFALRRERLAFPTTIAYLLLGFAAAIARTDCLRTVDVTGLMVRASVMHGIIGLSVWETASRLAACAVGIPVLFLCRSVRQAFWPPKIDTPA